MFTVTRAAAEQIRRSAKESNLAGLPLRIAVRRKEDGSLDYGMGFDEAAEEDLSVESEGVNVVIGPAFAEMLQDTTLDYVELEPGEFQFIFLNPNDPNYSPPTES